MKNILSKVVKFSFCFFCWLTISPLYYYLAGRWKLKRGRLLLMLVSPLFLITYLIIILLGYATYFDYERKYYFADEDRIERITGVRFPDIEIIEYNEGKRGFTGDYSDRLIVEFEELPSEKVYQTLDSLIESGKTGWRKNEDAYVFSATWGNGMPAPKGESEDEDRSFSIYFKKGSKKATINSGMW